MSANGNDIVISGMSGRFPMSDTVDELAKNLYAGIDMVTEEDGHRWPKDLYGMNSRMGKIKDYSKFDATFFGLMEQMTEILDPQSRLLLEATYEAIVDAGINPQSMRGSRTGVYIGMSVYPMIDNYPEEHQPDLVSNKQSTMFQLMAGMRCLYANRISYVFDFRGPSLMADTACSASLTAFNLAYNDLRLGNTDYAIIGGTHMTLQPFILQMQQESGLCSPRGVSAVLDQSADGFVKGEAVVVLVLQRRPQARRVYARVLTSRLNIDGKKTIGMFYPSAAAQQDLMVKSYSEAGIDPLELTLFEGHLTGTKAGDPQEVKSIYKAYCELPGRTEPLPLGVLKSNIGHTEGASGLASIVKVIIAYENESIPPNINMTQLKDELKAYCPPLMPITQPYPYKPGIAGINNFGIGGANGHVLLEPNYKLLTDADLSIADPIPRLVNICGRTESAVNYIMDFIQQNPRRVTKQFLALLAETMRYTPDINSSGFPYRGTLFIKKTNGGDTHVTDDGNKQYDYRRQLGFMSRKTQRPLWLLFPGLGGQWPGMARALMPVQVFADKLGECHQILHELFGVDLRHILLADDPLAIATMTAKFISTTAMEIALYEVIRSLDIPIAGIIGHSFGEIACGYADGCLTTRQAMIVSYYRGSVTENDPLIPPGLMAVVGLSKSRLQPMLPQGVRIACNNSKDSVVISGPVKQMKQTIEQLSGKQVFVRQLDSSGIPYHTDYLQSSAEPMLEAIKQYIPAPKLRSSKWVSTSLVAKPNIDNTNDDRLMYASAEYYVYNLVNPVEFYDKLSASIPTDAVVLELGPHGVFKKVVTETLADQTVDYLSLIQRDQNDQNLDRLLAGIGQLYQYGYNPCIENLYPRVEWPVGRSTPSIGSLIKWDHRVDYEKLRYPTVNCRYTAGDMNVELMLNTKDESYYLDHSIDGQPVFPATGYLMLAWRQLAAHCGKLWTEVPVVFENIQLRRATFLQDSTTTMLKVKYHPNTGDFAISENDNVCVVGRCRLGADDDLLVAQNLVQEVEHRYTTGTTGEPIGKYRLSRADIYKELRIMGYDYGPAFQRLVSVSTADTFGQLDGTIEWDGRFVTYLDAMLQSMALTVPFRKLMVPVMMKSIRIDPRVLFAAIKRYRLVTTAAAADNKSLSDNKSSDDLNLPFSGDTQEPIDNEDRDQSTTTTIRETMGEIFTEQYDRFTERFCVYRSRLPFVFDTDTKLLVTYGVEVENVAAFPIPRRMDTTDLVVDSYEFLANNDCTAYMDGSDQHRELIDYLELCKSMALKVKREMCLKQMVCQFDCKQLIDTKTIENLRNGRQENHIIFRWFDQLLAKVVDINQNVDQLTDQQLSAVLAELSADRELDLNKDLINQSVAENERLVRALVDIVSENLLPKKEWKVLEINPSAAGYLAPEVYQLMTGFAVNQVSVDYHMLVACRQSVPEEFRPNAVEWRNVGERVAMKSSNLIVYRDTPDIMWTTGQLDMFVNDISDSILTNGFLLAMFRYRLTEPELALQSLLTATTSTTGTGCSSDKQLVARIQEFTDKLCGQGLRLIAQKSDTIGTTGLLFRKLLANRDQMVIPDWDRDVIRITDDYGQWFDKLKLRMSETIDTDHQNNRNIWLINDNNNDTDSTVTGIIGLMNCLRLEPGGQHLRCIIHTRGGTVATKQQIDFHEKPYSDILANDLVINVLNDRQIVGTYRHQRLSGLTKSGDDNKILSDNYYLNLGQTRDLASLEWFDGNNIVAKHDQDMNYDLNNSQVTKIPVNIYSSGLTFHDVMVATGRIPSGPQLLFTDCLIGSEFAGRRQDTGQRVMGFEMSRCFATGVNAGENMITRIPDQWSMVDAVTVLSTYSTAWYGLIVRAGLKRGDRVLIHSAAGGVGQAAINICRYYGCDIFCTVGTEEKRQFLIKEYSLSGDRLYSSRDLQFRLAVMKSTRGKGVDIVLNSLAGDKLLASYECLANSGRFVELGKFDLAQNRQLGMFDFLRDISFIGLAADVAFAEQRDFAQRFFQWMHSSMATGADDGTGGCVRPLPRTVFEARDAERAFRYMTTGKHIGKIVLKIRDEEDREVEGEDSTGSLQLIPAPKMMVSKKTYFNPNKSYIITGGLGGFGLELMHWMSGMGAKRFLLTSRSGLRTDYQRYVVNRFVQFGQTMRYFAAEVRVSTADCLTSDGCRQLLGEAQELGPIGGIFHLALQLNDCLMDSMSLDKFRASVDTKYRIFDNLDQLTRRSLDYPLDYFVVFSSVSCGKGNAGQSNYSYGNSLCERLCEQRRRDGLHGLAVQYGPVGDVGVFASETSDQLLKFSTMDKQRINSCCDVLDRLLQIRQPVVTSYIKRTQQQQSGGKSKKMVRELWRALGIDPRSTPDHLTLGEIGLESMFAVELQQELEREYSVTISLNHVKSISIGMLKDYESGREEKIRKHLDSIREFRAELLKSRFVIPGEPTVRLNTVTAGKPIYFMPSIDQNFYAYESMARKLNRPAIGLNWTREASRTIGSMRDMVAYYSQLLDKLEPTSRRRYDVFGYFDGALLCAKLLAKGRVDRAVIVDVIADHKYMDSTSNLKPEQFIDFIMKLLSKELPDSLRDRLGREMSGYPDMDAKLKYLGQELRDFGGKTFVAPDLDEILANIWKRYQMLIEYRRLKLGGGGAGSSDGTGSGSGLARKLKWTLAKKLAKLSGKLIMIKPFKFDTIDNLDDYLDRSRQTYFLPGANEMIDDTNTTHTDTITVQTVDTPNSAQLHTGAIEEQILAAFNKQ